MITAVLVFVAVGIMLACAGLLVTNFARLQQRHWTPVEIILGLLDVWAALGILLILALVVWGIWMINTHGDGRP